MTRTLVMGDPQAPFSKLLEVLDRHQALDGDRLASDVVLVSIGDHFDYDLIDWHAAGQDGLKFLPGTFCPHYDTESLRRPRYESLVGSGALGDGFAADDGVGLLFQGRDFSEAVASLPGQHAYRIERRRGNNVEETQVRARLLR